MWDDDFVMVELVSILSEEICVGLAAGAWCDESEIIFAGKEDILKSLVEEICVGLAAGAWCDESEIIFAGKEDILKSLVACYRTRSFLSRVSSVFVGIVKASN